MRGRCALKRDGPLGPLGLEAACWALRNLGWLVRVFACVMSDYITPRAAPPASSQPGPAQHSTIRRCRIRLQPGFGFTITPTPRQALAFLPSRLPSTIASSSSQEPFASSSARSEGRRIFHPRLKLPLPPLSQNTPRPPLVSPRPPLPPYIPSQTLSPHLLTGAPQTKPSS